MKLNRFLILPGAVGCSLALSPLLITPLIAQEEAAVVEKAVAEACEDCEGCEKCEAEGTLTGNIVVTKVVGATESESELPSLPDNSSPPTQVEEGNAHEAHEGVFEGAVVGAIAGHVENHHHEHVEAEPQPLEKLIALWQKLKERESGLGSKLTAKVDERLEILEQQALTRAARLQQHSVIRFAKMQFEALQRLAGIEGELAKQADVVGAQIEERLAVLEMMLQMQVDLAATTIEQRLAAIEQQLKALNDGETTPAETAPVESSSATVGPEENRDVKEDSDADSIKVEVGVEGLESSGDEGDSDDDSI